MAEIKDARRSTVGYLNGSEIQDSRRSTVGYLNGNEIQDSRRSTVGYLNGNEIQDSRRSTVGYADGGGPIHVKCALSYLFFISTFFKDLQITSPKTACKDKADF